GLRSPAVSIIGPVVAVGEHLAWFEQRPLHGRRVLVTRPRGQAGPLAQRLEELGAVPLLLPVVEIRPPQDWAPVDAAIEQLAAFLRPLVAGQRVLLARADRGREVLREELQGIAEVHQVAVYSQVDAVNAEPAVLDTLRRGEVDYALLTSSNIARALARVLDEPCRARLQAGHTRIVSISPVTSAAIRELGWPVAAEAEEYTMAGVGQALVRL